jgi:hypothetical protein
VRTGRDDERLRRQRMRSIAIALALAALVAIFYVTTIVRFGSPHMTEIEQPKT